MHSNLWATLYLTLVPAVLFLLIGTLLKLVKKKTAKVFLSIGVALLLLPLIFFIGHFATINKEMRLRAGTYVVSRQENLGSLCSGKRFDSLTLTVEKGGNFYFNYLPCFADTIKGRWNWHDDLVTTGTTFDRVNDSLYLEFMEDSNDSILLAQHQKKYLIFSKVPADK